MNSHPSAWVYTVTLTPPSLADNTADADRLAGALRSVLQDTHGGRVYMEQGCTSDPECSDMPIDAL